MTKAAYQRRHFIEVLLTVSKGESVIIMVGSKAAGATALEQQVRA